MTELQAQIADHRLERARETLEEAHLLAAAERWNVCVNRLYYACFYAVSALLLIQDLSSSKHSGVRGLFNLHFVKTGKVSRELGALFNDLFENRQKATMSTSSVSMRSRFDRGSPRRSSSSTRSRHW